MRKAIVIISMDVIRETFFDKNDPIQFGDAIYNRTTDCLEVIVRTTITDKRIPECQESQMMQKIDLSEVIKS